MTTRLPASVLSYASLARARASALRARLRARTASNPNRAARTDGRTDRNPARRTAVRLARRYFRAAPVVAASIGLATTAEAGHLANAGLAWAVLLLGLAGTTVATAARPGKRWPTAALAAAITMWLSLAWFAGPLARACACAWVGGTAVAAHVWAHRRRRRDRIEVLGGTWKWWERERRAYTVATRKALERHDARWPSYVAATGLDPGFQLRRLVGDRHCYSLHVEIPAGHDLVELRRAQPGLETALNANRETTSIEGEARARGAVIRWTQDGGERPDLRWAGPSGARLAEPLEVAEYEDRTLLLLQFGVTAPDPHALITGASGAGKTTFLRLCIAEFAGREDVIVWAIDMAKAGAHFRVWRNYLDRLATEPDDVMPMLHAISRVIRARARWLGENGHDDWPTGPRFPQIVLIIDELSEIARRVKGAINELESIAMLGRQVGVTLLLATQRSTDDALGNSSTLRSQVRLRIAFPADSRDATATFDQGRTASKGWNAGALPGPGWCLVSSTTHPSPRQAHAKLVSREQAAEVDAAWGPRRPAWDAASAVVLDEGAEPVQEGGQALPRPAPMPTLDTRLVRLWQAIEELPEGAEFSGRGLSRPGLDKNWISKEGLPHFRERGLIEKVSEFGKWRRAIQDEEAVDNC